MRLETHIKLALREIIDNWRYIDALLVMMLLLFYVGFTDPCERCAVKYNGVEQTCKQAFLSQIGYEETDYGVQKKDVEKQFFDVENSFNLSYTNNPTS